DPAAVRRISGGEADRPSGNEWPLLAGIEIHHPDARSRVGEADISQLRGLRGKAGGEDHPVPDGEITMVVAVAVHHRDAPPARVAEARLGDVSDPGVEYPRRARDGGVGQAGTFMRCPAPVVG